MVKEKKQVERKDQRSELKNINRKVEKTTLGDLGVLSELKSKIEKGNADAKAGAESEVEDLPKAETTEQPKAEVKEPKVEATEETPSEGTDESKPETTDDSKVEEDKKDE